MKKDDFDSIEDFEIEGDNVENGDYLEDDEWTDEEPQPIVKAPHEETWYKFKGMSKKKIEEYLIGVAEKAKAEGRGLTREETVDIAKAIECGGIGWDLFNALTFMGKGNGESDYGKCMAAKVAAKLLESRIKTIYRTQKAGGLRFSEWEQFEDFVSICEMCIMKKLPEYDLEKSPNFWSWIKFYLIHEGTMAENDAKTTYMAKKTKITVVSAENEARTKTGGEDYGDAFSYLESDGNNLDNPLNLLTCLEMQERERHSKALMDSLNKNAPDEMKRIALGKNEAIKIANKAIAKANADFEEGRITKADRQEIINEIKTNIKNTVKNFKAFDEQEERRIATEVAFRRLLFGGMDEWSSSFKEAFGEIRETVESNSMEAV